MGDERQWGVVTLDGHRRYLDGGARQFYTEQEAREWLVSDPRLSEPGVTAHLVYRDLDDWHYA